MGKSKSLDLPAAPSFYSDPLFGQGTDRLMNLGNRLTNFDFGGSLSPLQETINLDPEVTRLALQYAQNALTPAYKDTLLSLKNQAAEAGALNSTTFTDAITKAGEDLNSQYQSIVAQAALEDRSRALQNRVDLFGTGLNTVNQATSFAGTNQAQRNQFNLSNYENQVAVAMANKKADKGGLAGALTGGMGGAALGLAMAPFTGGTSLLLTGGLAAGGALAGGLGPQGTGGQILGTGASTLGAFGGFPTPTGAAPYTPRSAASNNPFGLSGLDGSLLQDVYAGIRRR